MGTETENEETENCLGTEGGGEKIRMSIGNGHLWSGAALDVKLYVTGEVTSGEVRTSPRRSNSVSPPSMLNPRHDITQAFQSTRESRFRTRAGDKRNTPCC